MPLELYLAYVVACLIVIIVPGPMVTLIIANSLTHGTRAGLLNVAGAQIGLVLTIVILIVGLASIMATMGVWFEWVRLFGAAYLVWLGIKLFRVSGHLAVPGQVPKPRGGFVLQGAIVVMSNPKTLLFFGAFIPQFVNPNGDYVAQVVLLGATFTVLAAIFDGGYAVLSGGAGKLLSARRMTLLSRASGACLIGVGVWLALARAR